ncbi:MAG: MFS transporter, partial [Gammaproteobacteria bacterium]
MNKWHHASTIIVGITSNIIETYDLSIYPFFSAYLIKVFFPFQATYTSLLSISSIFLFGYLSRPIGSLVFGYIGDYYGRKKALILSGLLMVIATAAIGMLPTFQSIGYFAPILLLILRVSQGLSFGGEYTGSVIYLVEHAEESKKNVLGSFAAMGSNLGILISSLVCLMMTYFFADQEVGQRLWRIPFLLSLLFAFISF